MCVHGVGMRFACLPRAAAAAHFRLIVVVGKATPFLLRDIRTAGCYI